MSKIELPEKLITVSFGPDGERAGDTVHGRQIERVLYDETRKNFWYALKREQTK